MIFNRDIAPIIFKNCSPCHRPSQPGPFNLLTYADVKKRTKEIAKVTAERTMPPWLPEPGYGDFKEERRLSREEMLLIQSWFEKGALEGDAADLPHLPQWSEVELDPRYDEPHLHLGILWFDQERLPQAQSEFETVERLNPNNYLAQGFLGLLEMNQGHLQAAEVHLRAALRLNPNDTVAQENLRRVLQAGVAPHK